MDPLISHQDVTTIMEMMGDIRREIVRIRKLLEGDDGEEEASEDDT
jgi:hypothetical protein